MHCLPVTPTDAWALLVLLKNSLEMLENVGFFFSGIYYFHIKNMYKDLLKTSIIKRDFWERGLPALKLPGIPVSISHLAIGTLPLQMCVCSCSCLYAGTGDLNSGLCGYTASLYPGPFCSPLKLLKDLFIL